MYGNRKKLHVPSLLIGIVALIVAFSLLPIVNSIEKSGWIIITICAFALSISGILLSSIALSKYKAVAALVLSILSMLIILGSAFLMFISLGGQPTYEESHAAERPSGEGVSSLPELPDLIEL